MRAALVFSLCLVGVASPALATSPEEEQPVQEVAGPDDQTPRSRDFITPGKSNLSGEDPMFPARTSSRDPKPPPRAPKAPSAPSDAASQTQVHGLSQVELQVEFLAVSRSLSFLQLVGGDLRGHEVSVAPALALSARAFLLPKRVPFFSSLGVHLEYWRTMGLESSRVDGGPALPTVLSAMELGLRYRYDARLLLPGLELTPLASFHRSSFQLSALGPGFEPDVPNAEYLGAKLGLELSVAVRGPVRIEAEFSFLPVLSFGSDLDSNRFFDGVSGYGVQAQARLGVRLSKAWLLLLGAELLSYSLDLVPGARGAVQLSDRVLGVSVGLRLADPVDIKED
jgi:hypothetical protein